MPRPPDGMLKVRFKPGKIVATPGAMLKLKAHDAYAMECLANHLQGNWGLCCEEDAATNDAALEGDFRVMSVWPLPNDPDNFWIITEGDRSVTTFLLPEDY